MIVYLNRNLLEALKDPCVKGQGRNASLRVLTVMAQQISEFVGVKYFALIYIGISQNLTPLLTLGMSYFMTGEKIKLIDLLLILLTMVGVGYIIVGYEDFDQPISNHDERYHLEFHDSHYYLESPHLWTVLFLIMIPASGALQTVLMRKMREVHENSVSCYVNPILALTMYITIQIKGLNLDFILEGRVTRMDYVIYSLMAVAYVLAVQFK